MTSHPRSSPVPPTAGGLTAARGAAGPDAAAYPGGGERPGGPVPGLSADGPPPGRGEAHRAMLAYLGVPFTLAVLPLAIYLASLRNHPYARWHAAQATVVAVTTLLYMVCCLIAGAMLALDSLQVATFTVIPLLAALWVSVLVTVIRAAGAVSQGVRYDIPRWLRLR
jgi:Domain of unknown function (DUF4870)